MAARLYKILSFCIAAILILTPGGSLWQPGLSQDNSHSFIDPQLFQKTEKNVPVIVSAGSSAEAKQAVLRAGGEVVSDLWLIGAVSARLPVEQIRQVASQPGVRSLVADSQSVVPAAAFDTVESLWQTGKSDQRRKLGQVHLDAPQLVPAVSLPDGGFLSIVETGKVVVINPDGSERARSSLGINGFKNPLTLSADGTVYAVSENNRVFAITSDGQIRWTFVAPNKFFDGAVIGLDGSVIAVDERQVVYALDPQSGLRRWSLNLSQVVSSTVTTSPAVGPDGTVYIVNTRDPGDLFAVSPDGELKWRYTGVRSKRFNYSPVVTADAVYTASIEQMIYAVNLDGSMRYTLPTSSKIFAAPVVDASGNLYAACEHHFYALDSAGNVRFAYPNGPAHFKVSPLLSSDGSIAIVALEEAKLLAFNTADGSLAWQGDVAGAIKSNPMLDGFGDIVLGTDTKHFYVFRLNGDLVTHLLLDDRILQSPAVQPSGALLVRVNDRDLITLGPLAEVWNGRPDVEPGEIKREWKLNNPLPVDIGADLLHNKGITGDNITIAVVDSGVDL